MNKSVLVQTTEIKNVIKKGNFVQFVNFLNNNNIKWKGTELYHLLLYAIEHHASLDIIKYIEYQYGANEILEYLLKHNIKYFRWLFNHHKYHNDYVLRLLYLSKYHIKTSNEKLNSMIKKEQNQIIISKRMYDYALQKGNHSIIKLFLINDTQESILAINKKYNLLLYSVKYNQYEILISLLKHFNIQHQKIYMPLLLASIKRGRIDMVKLILQYPIDINNNSYKNGFTPLMYSIFYKQQHIIKCLLEAKANVNCIDNHGNTALIIALKNKLYEIMKMLIQYGANINHTNFYEDTPLIISIKKKYNKIAMLLVDNGADVNAKDSHGDTILILATKSENKDMVEYLLDHGANINDKDINGNTPLFIAYYNCMIDIISILIKKKANINEKKQYFRNYCINARFPKWFSIKCKILDRKWSKCKCKRSLWKYCFELCF